MTSLLRCAHSDYALVGYTGGKRGIEPLFESKQRLPTGDAQNSLAANFRGKVFEDWAENIGGASQPLEP